MSLPLPQDTPTTAPQPSLDSARQAHPSEAPAPSKIPLRARLSLLWQRSILTVRWFFRIPIDDVKEQQLTSALTGLMQNDRNLLKSLNTLIDVSNQMQRRLLFYEAHIPRMRDLKREFDREEALLSKAAQSPQRESEVDLNHGILHVPPSNGHKPRIEIVRP